MPTQERGFFTCDFCRLVCDTLDEATEHEYHCPKRPPGARPPAGGPPPSQYPPRHHLQGASSPYAPGGMPPLSEVEGYGGPPPHPQSASAAMHAPYPPPYKLRAIALIGPNDRSTGISPEDTLACQSIELFEATPGHDSEFDASRSGGTPVVPRQVGIRCVHCAKAQMPPSSYCIIFPASLGTVASSARLMADNHLSTCQVAPPEVRDSCDAAAKRRQPQGSMEGRNAEEEERSHMALLDYCVGFCQHMGIVNKQPHKTGIAFADTEMPPMHPYGPPQTPAETPGSHRGGGYSADRMGPPMYDPRMSRGMMPVMGGGGAHNPSEPIAPTPLQRRRDRPGMEAGEPTPGMYSVDRSEASHTPGGYGMPTPYRQQDPHGGEGGYGSEVQTPVQPNFEGKDPSYPTPHSAQRPPPGGTPNESSPGYNPYDLPANFPFYQETDRSWHCKFCSHVHPSYRDPQSIWSTASGAPPPGDFIDGHLSMCRSYHQSMPSPPMYQGGPQPPYGAPHPYMPPGYPPPPGWDGPPGPGMHPQHMGYPPMGQPMMGDMPYPPPFPPSHMDPMGRPYPGGGPEDPMYGDRRSRHPPQGLPPHSNAPPSQPSGSAPPAGGPPRREDMGDSIRHSIAHLVAKENDFNTKEDEIGNSEKLVLDEDKLLLTDYFFYLMKQLRLCRFSEADRKTRGGKREKIQLGFGGLQCVHCSDVPNPRKFFWSNVDRLANSFAEIPGHVLKCRRCPQQTKDALTNLKQFHPEQMARLPRGSQKVFFRRMWRRLHDEDPEDGSALTDQTNTEKSSAAAGTVKVETPRSDASSAAGRDMSPNENSPMAGDETPVLMQRPTPEAARVLAETSQLSGPPSPTSRVLLAIPEDKEWLSDMDCFIRKQLEIFCATEADVATAQSDRKFPVHVGQVGIRCVHCSLSSSNSSGVAAASGTAVSFPFSISAIYESVREFQRLHLDSCENVPASVKTKLAAFKGSSSLSSVLRKYYVLAAKALGLQDTAEGMRSGGEPVPLGSQAAFSFSDAHVSDEAHRTSGAKVSTSPSKPSENSAMGETSDDAGSDAPQPNPKRTSGASEDAEEPPMKKVKSEEEMEDPEGMAAENGEKAEATESTTQPPSDEAENPTDQVGDAEV